MNMNEVTLTSAEARFENLLHHYMVVLERLTEERKALAQHTGELHKAVVRLSAQLEKYPELEAKLKHEVGAAIREAAKHLAQDVSQPFQQETAEHLRTSIQQLRQATEQASLQLQQSQRREESQAWWWVAGLVGLPIVTSVLLVKLLLPTPYLPLTGDQLQTYQSGQLLERLWPQLSKAEKSRLHALLKTPSEENASVPNND